ncbi:serine protease inhibitor A3G-like [Daktulosphaira vitifoliae]|uniref:serine protease inhibitor A3G-like n=1 Tax=Daktulosphaira vitifoliae TaxID=58002 RepID=UPI0021AA01D5|nr:serine protease inhibitor A3G-like [Daktulosphaira vitifoliae]
MALTVATLNTLRVANHDFSMALYSKLNKDNENLFYSPISIHIVLLMAGIGAASNTYNEIFDTIRMPKNDDTLEPYEKLLSTLNVSTL